MSERTKGEWKNDGHNEWLVFGSKDDTSYIIADCSPDGFDIPDIFECVANAEFICKAVNNHDALISALKKAREELDEYNGIVHYYGIHDELLKEIDKVLTEAA